MKNIDSDKVKIQVESLVKKCFNEKENLPHNLKIELNGITRSFIIRAKQIYQTNQNTAFNKTLCNLRNNKSIKIVKYDKGNGICIMSSQDYLNTLNVIVEDRTKFKLIK